MTAVSEKGSEEVNRAPSILLLIHAFSPLHETLNDQRSLTGGKTVGLYQFRIHAEEGFQHLA